MTELLALLAAGKTLTVAQTTDAFDQIMTGQADPLHLASLLSMIQVRGATVDELTGAASVMRSKVAAVEVPAGLTVIDTCGTGGDHSDRFNVSTTAALVAAAAGRSKNVAVAKHGNRSATSNTGSAQVLETLGVNLQAAPETLTNCLDEAGFCFCFAPGHHPAMKHVMPVRMSLKIPTIFNLLGPMTNPAGAKRQVMGVFKEEFILPIANVLKNLGAEHVMVLRGQTPNGKGMCDLSTMGVTQIAEVCCGEIKEYEFDPASLGIAPGNPDEMVAESPEASAEIIGDILSGKNTSSPRDIVALNAASGLVVGGAADDLKQGLQMAYEAIDSGAAKEVLNKVVGITNG